VIIDGVVLPLHFLLTSSIDLHVFRWNEFGLVSRVLAQDVRTSFWVSPQ